MCAVRKQELCLTATQKGGSQQADALLAPWR